jgi:prepilin-type processing-associated H-X9-DG protein
MSDIPPSLQPKTKKLVQSSFVLGIASILCGITALPAIIQSIRALVRIRKERASKTVFGKVIFSLIFSSSVLIFIIFCAASALFAARGLGHQINCTNNMKILALAIKNYDYDYALFPPAEWCDVILTNKMDTSSQAFVISKDLHCPTTPKKQLCGYAMNRNLVGIRDTSQIAQDTVLLFESDAGWNAVGGPEIAVPRHHNGLNVALVDGSVQQINFKDLGSLRWDPYTNSVSK